MNTATDLIHLPYTPDLTQAGIAYACRRLACTYLTEAQKTYISMRDLVTLTAASLAFQRYLSSESIPHTIQGSFPYTDPASYALLLGGRRCMVKSDLIYNRKVLRNLHTQPAGILARQAMVDVEDLEPDLLLEDDLLVFALVFALITRDQTELKKALDAGQPACLIHTMPENWANPLPDLPLGEIALKSNHDRDINLNIGGRNPEGNFREETISLKPHLRTCLENPYQSLAYLRTDQPMPSLVGLSSTTMHNPYVVRPGQWGNIWVYGLEIILAGYLTRGEFRHMGTIHVDEDSDLPIVSGKKKSLRYGQLHTLAGLFGWARNR